MIDDYFNLNRFAEQEGRRLLEARMLSTNGPLTPKQRDDVRAAVKAYKEKHGVSDKVIARQVGEITASVVSEVLSGKYAAATLDDHLRLLNDWMEVDARRRATRSDRKFVETGVARRMFACAEQSSRMRGIVLAHGPTGIGKTMCAHAIADKFPGTIYVRISKGNVGYPALRRMLLQRLRLTSSRGRGKSGPDLTIDETIFDKLRNSHRLLIIDEAHRLGDAALEFVRDIFDECGIPIVLICTKDLLDRIRRGADEDHGQFYRRLAWVCELARRDAAGRPGKGPSSSAPLFTIKEIKDIYERDKVRLDPGAQAYLLDIANDLGKGSLGRCDLIVDVAVRMERQVRGVDAEAVITLKESLLSKVERERFADHDMLTDIESRPRATAAAG